MTSWDTLIPSHTEVYFHPSILLKTSFDRIEAHPYRQQIGLLIHLVSLYLLIGELRLFIFKVMIEICQFNCGHHAVVFLVLLFLCSQR